MGGEAMVEVGGQGSGVGGQEVEAGAAVEVAAGGEGGRAVEGPSVEGPGVEAPSVEGPVVEGPGVEGPVVEAPVGEVPEGVRLRGEVEALRVQAVASHRRALLAENAGLVVPELVAGDSVEALEASVEVAKRAYESVRAATVAEMAASARVGAGNGMRGNPVDVEGMSATQKIAHGLRRE